jgi:cytidine deaminase
LQKPLEKIHMDLNTGDLELVHLALELIQKREGEYSTVGAAIKTVSGKIFTGVNVEQVHASPCSMCAEYSAIGQMQTDGNHTIETVIAIKADETILPPCGKCREMLRQFGNPNVILSKNENGNKVQLNELIPHWES